MDISSSLANDISLPNKHFQGTGGFSSSVPPNNLLPVLGLCAPNAYQSETSLRNFSRSNGRHRRAPTGLEFPFSLAPCSGSSVEAQAKGREGKPEKLRFQDVSAESLRHQLRNSMPDSRIPFSPVSISLSFYTIFL